MNLPPKFLLATTLIATASSFAASIPRTIVPDNVVHCDPSVGCVSQSLYGRTYKVMATPRFTVMVSVSREGRYTRADVSVTNTSGMPLNVTPEDFRVEVVTPKPKVLLYVPPAHLTLPPARAAAPTLATGSMAQKLLKAPAEPPMTIMQATTADRRADTQTAEATSPEAADQRQAVEREAADQAKTQQHLAAMSIAPNEATSGRVYFERDKKAKLVNVVIPIAGVVFEFPYDMKKRLPDK